VCQKAAQNPDAVAWKQECSQEQNVSAPIGHRRKNQPLMPASINDVGNSGFSLEMGEVQPAARTLGLDVVILEIRSPEDFAHAFETLKGRAQALYIAAIRARLPTRSKSTP